MISRKPGPACDVCGRTTCLNPARVLTQWAASPRIDFTVCDRASCNATACSEVGAQMREAKRRAHADTEPQLAFKIGDIVDWSPNKSGLTGMLRATLGDTIRGRVYQLSPLCIKTTSGHKLDTSRHPAGVVLVQAADTEPQATTSIRRPIDLSKWTDRKLEYYSARLEKDMDAAIAAQHERAVSMLADPTVPPGEMRYVLGYDLGYPNGGVTVVEERHQAPTDPLDVEYDHIPLRRLVMFDEMYRREEVPSSPRHAFTPAQRAAISAHWSAQLRAKVDATKQKEREQVVSEYDEDRP